MKLGFLFAVLALGLIVPNAYAATSSIEVNGKTYEVTYDATGLDVDGLEADTESATLSALVTVTDVEGILQLTLDRSFFDSKTTEGADDEFIVLVDGDTAIFTEDTTDSQRILTISVPSGAISVDVIGTVFGAGEPTTEEPVEEAPVEETPVEETPVEEAPVEETPQETQCGPGTILQDGVCVLEQAPVEEAPVEEAPAEETPEVSQCGPGTILKDGECVLDESCGPGTILKDGVCVLEESAPTTSAIPAGQGTQFVAAIIGGFIIAFVVMMILWAIGRASRKKN